MRERIEAFIAEWEAKSTKSMFLDARLHPKIRVPLIDGLMAIIEAEAAPKAEKPKRGKAST